uniref:Endo/exonuclease/phosphatase domain-containing protein n=1 Tax=Steinernema glaseri TaxID=37863 RepID=A0A1I7Y090_9BILA
MGRVRRTPANERYSFNRPQERTIRKWRPQVPMDVDRVARDVVNDIATRFRTNIGPSPAPGFIPATERPEFIFHAVSSPAKNARLAQRVQTPRPKLAVTKLNRTTTPRRRIQCVEIDEDTTTSSRSNTVAESDSEIEIVHVKLTNPKASAKVTLVLSGQEEEVIEIEKPRSNIQDCPEIIYIPGEEVEKANGVPLDDTIILLDDTPDNSRLRTHKAKRNTPSKSPRAGRKSVFADTLRKLRNLQAAMKLPKFPPLVVNSNSIFSCGASGNYAVQYRRSCEAPSSKFAIKPTTFFKNANMYGQDPAIFIDSLSYHSQLLYGVPLRKWEEIQEVDDPSPQIRVCSYNVLCQPTIDRTAYLYRHTKEFPYSLEWESRWLLLEKEFKTLRADIFCLQEVYYEHYSSHFLPIMEKLGYIGHYERKAGGTLDVVDGCAIFYIKDVFDEVQYRRVQMFAQDDTVLDKPNVGQVIRLRHKKTKRDICVANTHLIYNTRSGHRKFAQLALLLAHLKQVCDYRVPGEASSQRPDYIICGDMNMEPFCDIYRFIIEKKLDLQKCKQREMSGQGEVDQTIGVPMNPPLVTRLKNDCTLGEATERISHESSIWTHTLDFASSYFHLQTGNRHDCSTFHTRSALNPDFIFYSVKETYVHIDDTIQVQEGGLRLIQRLELPDVSEAEATLGPWPNPQTPSDHVPLLVDFALV